MSNQMNNAGEGSSRQITPAVDASRFATLIPELRLMIWETALENEYGIVIFEENANHDYAPRRLPSIISLVNQQSHAHAMRTSRLAGPIGPLMFGGFVNTWNGLIIQPIPFNVQHDMLYIHEWPWYKLYEFDAYNPEFVRVEHLGLSICQKVGSHGWNQTLVHFIGLKTLYLDRDAEWWAENAGNFGYWLWELWRKSVNPARARVGLPAAAVPRLVRDARTRELVMD